MRYNVIFDTENHTELVSQYWTLSEAMDNAMIDARNYNNGDDNGTVSIVHHIDGSWFVGEVSEVNSDTDNMIDTVIEKISTLGAVSNGGYGYIQMNGKSIRIKDHTHSPRNGKCDVNVVIANKDATFNRFLGAREDLRFGSDDSLDLIIDEILYLVNQD